MNGGGLRIGNLLVYHGKSVSVEKFDGSLFDLGEEFDVWGDLSFHLIVWIVFRFLPSSLHWV